MKTHRAEVKDLFCKSSSCQSSAISAFDESGGADYSDYNVFFVLASN